MGKVGFSSLSGHHTWKSAIIPIAAVIIGLIFIKIEEKIPSTSKSKVVFSFIGKWIFLFLAIILLLLVILFPSFK